MQFNDAGAFGGDAGLTYEKATDRLTVAGGVTTGAAAVYINDTSNVGMTVGLTINQGGQDDSVLAFKSTDLTQL